MRVIVTGGSGFIGTNLVSYFHEQDWEVSNFDIARPRNQEHFSYWKEVNLLDRDRLIKETQSFQPSAFLHFGARTDLNEQHNLAGYAANIDGVFNVIDAIRSTPSIQRVVFASSQLVCRLGYTPKDDYDYLPSTLYGQSKVLTERIIRSADDIDAIWTIVRPTSLWGPWFDVPYKNFFMTISRNLYVHPGGVSTLKQWGFIGNTVYQIWKIIKAPRDAVHKKTFYLADYTPINLSDFADKVQATFDAKPIRTIPSSILKSVARFGDIAQMLGWKKPPLTSFRYQNIVTNELQDLSALEEITGPLPYKVDSGIDLTLSWLKESDNSRV
jgi:nucleoside-diphosphate-sugar epimerase